MSLLKAIKAQLGLSTTATQNFTLTAEAADGTMKLARGNAGATTQDILTVDAAGKVTFPQNTRTWQNMTGVGGRAVGATITNSTSYDIEVAISLTVTAGSGIVSLTVGGVLVIQDDCNSASDTRTQVSASVPAGATYVLGSSGGNATIANWAELR